MLENGDFRDIEEEEKIRTRNKITVTIKRNIMCTNTSMTYRGKINLVAMQHLNKLQVSSLSKIVRENVCVYVHAHKHMCMSVYT